MACYITCPQGLKSARDAYTDRMDRLTADTLRQRSCINDTLLYNSSIQAAFFRAGDFLDLCGNYGVILNSTKFQFAESEVEFVGFSVTSSGVQPTSSFNESINNFPTPTSLTDVRSWFGVVAQVAYTFATGNAIELLRHLLLSKEAFLWLPEIEATFQATKVEVVRQCKTRVCSFDSTLPTALAADWSKMAIGVWLT